MQATSSVFWIIKVACGAYIVVCTRLMGSKSSRWSVTWVVLFICLLLCFSAKAIATRNLAGYAGKGTATSSLTLYIWILSIFVFAYIYIYMYVKKLVVNFYVILWLQMKRVRVGDSLAVLHARGEEWLLKWFKETGSSKGRTVHVATIICDLQAGVVCMCCNCKDQLHEFFLIKWTHEMSLFVGLVSWNLCSQNFSQE